MVYSVVIDWCSLNCKFSEGKPTWNTSVYTVENLPTATRHFHKVEFIFRNKRLIATACSEPRDKRWASDMVLVKFENDVLYDRLFDFQAQEFLQYNKLKFNSFTRFDVALDFNFFAPRCNAWEGLYPEDLIKNYLNGRWVKMGKGKSATRQSYGKKVVHEYLRYGERDADLSYYLYNKTLEMQIKKLKPWIVENWIKSGLDIDKPVWRLEFSFKGGAKEMKFKNDDKVLNFYNLDILKEWNYPEVYKACVDKYFQFAKHTKTGNKSRMPRIELFKDFNSTGVLTDRSKLFSSNKMDKFLINRLNDTMIELQGTDDHLADMCTDLKDYYIYQRGMNLLAPQSYKNKPINPNPKANELLTYSRPDDAKPKSINRPGDGKAEMLPFPNADADTGPVGRTGTNDV